MMTRKDDLSHQLPYTPPSARSILKMQSLEDSGLKKTCRPRGPSSGLGAPVGLRVPAVGRKRCPTYVFG